MRLQCGNYELRPIPRSDLGVLLDLYRKCEDFLKLGPEPVASKTMVAKDIENSQKEAGIYLGIYTLNGDLVGVLDYIPNGYKGERYSAYISLLMIDPAFRNQGLGKMIVESIESEITNIWRVKTILSSVQVNNPDGLRFWETSGYRIVGGPELQSDGTTVLHLKKDL